MKRMNTLTRGLAASSLLLTGAAVHAAIDVSQVVGNISSQMAPVAAIGGAILLLVVGIKAFQWVRKALS